MQRPQLEHIIRAAAGITGAQEFVIIGSLLRHKLACGEIVRERLAATPVDDAGRQLCFERLKRLPRP